MAHDPSMGIDERTSFIARPETRVHRRALLLRTGKIAVAGISMCVLAKSSERTMASRRTDAIAPETREQDAPPAAPPPANLADRQVMRFADTEPASFDPAIALTPGVTPSVFEGLVNINWTNNQLEPAQAASYQSNADATVWTFTLRPSLTWSDGTPLTARDFEYAIKRIPDPAVGSEYRAAVASIKNGPEIAQGLIPPDQLGVVARDDTTLEITLNTPTPFFPFLVATWSYFPVPKHVIDKVGNRWTEATNIVSNGPYILKEWEHGQVMTLVQNPNYRGAKPIITSAEVFLYSDPLARGLAAYENGELDTALVSAADYDRVQQDPKLSQEMHGFPASSTAFINWDCTNTPTSDMRVRQALALGFDRASLITTVLKNYYLDGPTMLPPDIPGYNPAAALTGNFDDARQLLASAGFPGGQGWPSDFTIVYPPNDLWQTVLMYLQGEWRRNLGINVNLQELTGTAFSDYRKSRKTQPYNGLLSSWGSDYSDPANWHNFLFTSNTDFYNTHWKNDEFDSIVANAKGMTDRDARTKEYEKAEAILVREQSHLTISHGQLFYVIKPTLQGVFHPAILGSVPRPAYAYFTQ